MTIQVITSVISGSYIRHNVNTKRGLRTSHEELTFFPDGKVLYRKNCTIQWENEDVVDQTAEQEIYSYSYSSATGLFCVYDDAKGSAQVIFVGRLSENQTELIMQNDAGYDDPERFVTINTTRPDQGTMQKGRVLI